MDGLVPSVQHVLLTHNFIWAVYRQQTIASITHKNKNNPDDVHEAKTCMLLCAYAGGDWDHTLCRVLVLLKQSPWLLGTILDGSPLRQYTGKLALILPT